MRKDLGKCLLLKICLLPISVAMADVSVNVGGVSYDITTQYTSYNTGQVLIQAQPWWGNSSLAQNVANAVWSGC